MLRLSAPTVQTAAFHGGRGKIETNPYYGQARRLSNLNFRNFLPRARRTGIRPANRRGNGDLRRAI